MQLALQLWRACRVVIDVGLHTGTMSFDDAVACWSIRPRLERVNADGRSQTLHAVANATNELHSRKNGNTYDCGMTIADSRVRDINLKEFHDHLLSYGSIPIEFRA